MKALIKEAGVVRLVDVPRPEVRQPDDVLVQVLVAGICRTDLHVASGALPAADPITLGHEFAGRVVARGVDVALGVGALVTADPLIRDRFLGVDRHGAFAEYIVIPGSNVHALPDDLDPRIGAYVEPLAAAMAVLDAIAGYGRRAIVFGDSRFSRLVFDLLRRELDTVECVTAPVASCSVDVAVETSGTSREIALLVDALVPGGLLVLKSRNPTPAEFPVREIVAKNLTIRAKQYAAFPSAVELATSGKIDFDPYLGEVFPLAQYREAFDRASSDESQKQFLSCAD